MTQQTLQLSPDEPAPALRLRFLEGLNPVHESFSRLAAKRIAELLLPEHVEAALQEAHRLGSMATIESLAAYGIGDRIYMLPPRMRQAFLDALMQPLRGKVEDQLRRLKARAESIARFGELSKR